VALGPLVLKTVEQKAAVKLELGVEKPSLGKNIEASSAV